MVYGISHTTGFGQIVWEWSNKSLQATAMGHSVLTMTARLNIIIPSEARLPWLCLSSRR